jgi:hypothetical protein
VKNSVGVWTLDRHLVNHALLGYYPPMPRGLLIVWFAYSLVMTLAMLLLAGVGFRLLITPLNSMTNLLLLAILADQIFPVFMAGGNARFAVVGSALMLPALGYGAAHFRAFFRAGHFAISATAVGLVLAVWLTTLPGAFSDDRMTSYYVPVVGPYETFFGKEITASDRVALRATDPTKDSFTVRVLNEEYFVGVLDGDTLVEPDQRTIQIDSNQLKTGTELLIYSYGASTQPLLEIESAGTGDNAVFVTSAPDAWNSWAETGLNGVQYRWVTNQRPVTLP